MREMELDRRAAIKVSHATIAMTLSFARDVSIYVSKCKAGVKVNNGKQVKIYDTTLGDELLFNSYDLLRFAYRREVGDCILVDQEMVERYKMNNLQYTTKQSKNEMEEEDDKYYEKVMDMEVSYLV